MTALKKKIRPSKKEKALKTTLILFILAAIAYFVLQWHLGLLEEHEIKDSVTIYKDLSYTLFTTIVSIIVVTIAYTIYTEIDFKHKVEETILDSLAGNHVIISKYHQSDIVEIVKNCLIIVLGRNLSNNFFKHILKRQLTNISYRTQYQYTVGINPGTDPTHYNISQSIEYKKHIKNASGGKLKVSCFFYYKEDPFRRQPPTENVVFFREELTSKDFFDFLVSLKGKDQEILNRLGFSVQICDKNNSLNTIENTKIKADVVEKDRKKAIVITFDVLPSFASKDEDGFISFYAKICCNYPSDKDNYFYCVFPEPTEDALFRITFHESIVDKSNVHYISFIGNDNYELAPADYHNELIFKIKGNLDDDSKKHNAIFPHSGIVFHW
ncbi:MAG: hypothetical protein LBL57_00890 [Tannerella sp.]|nr:hypothetical protein [Tannerella sp.]